MQAKTGDTRPDEPLAAEAVRATIYADQAIASAEAEAQGDGPDTLVEGMHGEAFFILDRYDHREGWDTTAKQIRELHDELVIVGVAAARGAMIELAARRLAGTRRIEA